MRVLKFITNGLDGPGFNSARGKSYFSFPKFQTGSDAQVAFYLVDTGILFQE
jgi:hypothetical protein